MFLLVLISQHQQRMYLALNKEYTRMSNVSHASLMVTVLMCIALLVASAQCFVCGTEAVVTFKPCGHAVICAGCAERVKKCPTCKVLYMSARIILHDYVLLTV